MTRDALVAAYTQAVDNQLTGDLIDLNTPRLVEALWTSRGKWVDAHVSIEAEAVEWAVRIHIVVTAARLGLI